MRRPALTLIVTLTFGGLAVPVDADTQRGPRAPKIGVLQVGTQAAGRASFRGVQRRDTGTRVRGRAKRRV